MKIAQLHVKRMLLEDLKAHSRNPRRHPEPGSPEWEALAKSLEHDYFDPIIFNQRNGKLVSGHLRKKVMIEAGYTEADCVVVDYDEKTHCARMIAANKSSGCDDFPAVAKLLSEICGDGPGDVSIANYTEKSVERMMAGLGLDDDENVVVKIQMPRDEADEYVRVLKKFLTDHLPNAKLQPKSGRG